jgi:hypothetical protein
MPPGGDDHDDEGGMRAGKVAQPRDEAGGVTVARGGTIVTALIARQFAPVSLGGQRNATSRPQPIAS